MAQEASERSGTEWRKLGLNGKGSAKMAMSIWLSAHLPADLNNLRLLRFFTQRCNYWARLLFFAAMMCKKRSYEIFGCAEQASFAVTKWPSELCNLTH